MKRLDKIKERCDSLGLQTKLTTKQIELFDDDDKETTRRKRHLIVSIPEERDFKNIILVEGQDIEFIEKSNFDKFRFIKGYEAIWSEEFKVIECELQSDDILRPSRFLIRRLKSFLPEQDKTNKDDKTIMIFPSPIEKVKITIGDCSDEFSVLSNCKREYLFSISRISTRITIRIEGVEVKTHEEAKSLLLKIANSVLFQIDLNINIPIHLTPDRDFLRDIRRRKVQDKEVDFSSPKYEYDIEAMSLYWYARTAINMPLLQFLAFYQILEFYFPSFSYIEAQQKIKNLIKDPLFDVNKDTDVVQIINIIKLSAKGKSIGDERTQLKATIHSIIDNDSLTKFLLANEERRDFFDITKKTKSLAKHKISFSNVDNDLRQDVASRIYEIRCRIVHTKDEDDSELILPFSTDLIHLKYDLELIEYLARKTIIATSRPLKI
jgi:hypothetical protein